MCARRACVFCQYGKSLKTSANPESEPEKRRRVLELSSGHRGRIKVGVCFVFERMRERASSEGDFEDRGRRGPGV